MFFKISCRFISASFRPRVLSAVRLAAGSTLRQAEMPNRPPDGMIQHSSLPNDSRPPARLVRLGRLLRGGDLVQPLYRVLIVERPVRHADLEGGREGERKVERGGRGVVRRGCRGRWKEAGRAEGRQGGSFRSPWGGAAQPQAAQPHSHAHTHNPYPRPARQGEEEHIILYCILSSIILACTPRVCCVLTSTLRATPTVHA